MDGLSTFFDFLNRAGVVGLLIFIVYGGYKQWWVFGWQYRTMIQDRDDWKSSALGGTALATHIAEKTMPKHQNSAVE